MNYRKMILVEHLIDKLINYYSKEQYAMVFEMNGALYTGRFFQKNKHDRNFALDFTLEYGFEENEAIFEYKEKDAIQEIRSSFFDFSFGKERGTIFSGLSEYVSQPHHAFRDIVKFTKDYDKTYLNPDIQLPECIFSLRNIHTKDFLDFYLLSDESMKPISLIKLTSKPS